MTADTLKTTRVLELYQDFLSGKLINKQQAAEQYHVNVRSIQRDIDSIRDFLSEQCAKEGIVRKIEYDKKENGYRLVTQEIEQLSKGEVLALCKILMESRAFTKEQVEKQLQIILNLCVSQKEKSDIEWFISNELFHYHDPAHAAIDPDNLWMVAQAIRNQSVLEIEYQKLKDRQIVKRTVEPVGLMFSEYYFYLMGVITDHSTREAFHKKNDPYPTIYRLDRIQDCEFSNISLSPVNSVEEIEQIGELCLKNYIRELIPGKFSTLNTKGVLIEIGGVDKKFANSNRPSKIERCIFDGVHICSEGGFACNMGKWKACKADRNLTKDQMNFLISVYTANYDKFNYPRVIVSDCTFKNCASVHQEIINTEPYDSVFGSRHNYTAISVRNNYGLDNIGDPTSYVKSSDVKLKEIDANGNKIGSSLSVN